jgi:hypothetical protein
MIFKGTFKKAIAVFMILITVGNVITPTVSWALTAGPTAPEATSFEPVDTTDMINTITGDLAYNIPLLEVPGPAGSYPLSLSYHSNIQPNMDASWVGLGWTLNPGSISRLTNGVPDDINGAKSTDRIFWEGGSTTVNTYGVSVGISNLVTVGGGLSFAEDTYKGRGVGGYASVGVMLGEKSPFNVNASVGISPYGGTSFGIGIGVASQSELNVSANLGLTFNDSGSISAGLSGGVGFGTRRKGPGGNPKGGTLGGSILGASISSGNGGVSFSVGGFENATNNSHIGQISTSGHDSQVDIPVYFGVNIHIGHSYHRYWMDQTESYTNYGSLFFPNSTGDDLSLNLYDTYHMQGQSSLTTGDNPAKYMDGSFADYDQYSVNAQGLGGNIRPYHYLLSLYSQDIVKGTDKQILSYKIPQQSTGVGFRFVNDFSNRVISNQPDIEINKTFTTQVIGTQNNDNLNYNKWQVDVNRTWQDDDQSSLPNQIVPLYYSYGEQITGIEGYNGDNSSKRILPNVPGSKHIEYFTNDDIINNLTDCHNRGFIECSGAGFTRYIDETNMTGKVGAFSITNASGVTYHFSLPAYSFNEYVYSQNKDSKSKVSFNKLIHKGKYAYTWYLTGVTGPDFVDRGPNGDPDGIINDYDWGYWVDFQYGKWADNYKWRNPSEGFSSDLDDGFQNFSKGEKEVYYLNAIRTKTHTAFFVKELRADGKGTTSTIDECVLTDNSSQVTWVDSGGFKLKAVPLYSNFQKTEILDNGEFKTSVTINKIKKQIFPTSSLRLSSIILCENNNVAIATAYNNSSNNYNHKYTYHNQLVAQEVPDYLNLFPGAAENYVKSLAASNPFINFNGAPTPEQVAVSSVFPPQQTVTVHYGENVLDVNDIANGFPLDKAVRIIDFNHDYSLAQGSSNSYDLEGNIYKCHDSNCADFFPSNDLTKNKLGKLTLNSISFKGKGGEESLVPDMNFYYDYRNPEIISGNINSIDVSGKLALINVSSLNKFSVGDLIKFSQNSNEFYGYVKNNTTSLSVKIISQDLPTSGWCNIQKTKNPPYNKDLYDMWGMYKADFQDLGINNIERLTTYISAQNTDAWALREIESSTGSTIKIQYESDTYSKSVFNSNLSLPLSLVRYESTSTTGTSSGSYDFKATSSDDYGGKIDPSPAPGSKVLSMILYYQNDDPNFPIDLTRLYKPGEYAHGAIVADFQYMGSDNILNNTPIAFQAARIESVTNSSITVSVQTVPSSSLTFAGLSFVGGVLEIKTSTFNYGGGTRVASIGSFDEITDQERYTTYKYEFNDPIQSSGYTSYEPINIKNYTFPQYQSTFNEIYYSPHLKVLSMARELPPPGVYYGKVRLGEYVVDGTNTVRTLPGYTDYEFESLNEGMIDLIKSTTGTSNSGGYYTYKGQQIGFNKVTATKVAIKDYLQRMGQLRSVVVYDSEGHKITETISHYLHDQQTDESFNSNSSQYLELTGQFNNQGVIQESFNHARWVKSTSTSAIPELQGLISKKENYPLIPTGTTTINYKSGLVTDTRNLAFDFYNGSVTKTLSTDGYGNSYLSTSVPAYHFYSGMGLKTVYPYNTSNVSNKHMIDQVAYTKVEKVSGDATQSLGLVSASAQTWSNQIGILNQSPQTGIWRMKSSYSFIGDDALALRDDGLYPASSFTEFNNWTDETTVPSVWQKNAEITLYDTYSHALEASDVNGNFAATIMSADQTRVVATGSNTSYKELAYLNAEDSPIGTYYGGGVTISANGARVNTTAHSGAYSIQLNAGDACNVYSAGSTAVTPGKMYHASAWVKSSNNQLPSGMKLGVSFDGAISDASAIATKKAGEWYLIDLDFTAPATFSNMTAYLQNNGLSVCYFDDFRVHPLNASMTAYVYNSWGELSHILNANNLYTQYEYDGMGRLVRTYQETFQNQYGNNGVAKISETSYNYSKPYMVALNSSKTGGSGSIFPAGNVSIKQGESYTFQLTNTCSRQLLQSVLVDGQVIFLNQPATTLLDGTQVSATQGGVTFNNIMSPHQVVAQYYDFTGQGYAECAVTTGGCLTGAITYYYLNACGDPGVKYLAATINDVPADLRKYVPSGGCTATSGSNCVQE